MIKISPMLKFNTIETLPITRSKENIDEVIEKNFSPFAQKLIEKYPYLKESLNEQKEELDQYGFEHIKGTTRKSEILSEFLGLDDDDKNTLVQAAILHDYGKIAPEIKHIFQSSKEYANFSDEEKDLKERHSTERLDWMKRRKVPSDIIHIVASHHEPEYRRQNNERRKASIDTGNDRRISDGRRRNVSEHLKYLKHIFSLIDKTDAILNPRSYKKAVAPLECENILRKYFTNEDDALITHFLIEKN